MPDANTIVRERQSAIRRELDRRGISLKAVALDSGIPYPTVVSYFPGEKDKVPATLSGASIYLLAKALPLDLLSLVLPVGFHIVHSPEDIDHDAIATLAAEYVAAKNRAHHPESEAGRDIGPREQEDLTSKVIQLARLAA